VRAGKRGPRLFTPEFHATGTDVGLEPAERTRLTALVVDDDPDFRTLTRRLLERAGYEVQEVEDGALALHVLERSAPLLLVVDERMPGLRGSELLHEAERRGLLACVRAIVMQSSELIPEVRVHCHRLQKGTGGEQLLTIARALATDLAANFGQQEAS
jgi:CheY-like chemotaxis protein